MTPFKLKLQNNVDFLNNTSCKWKQFVSFCYYLFNTFSLAWAVRFIEDQFRMIVDRNHLRKFKSKQWKIRRQQLDWIIGRVPYFHSCWSTTRNCHQYFPLTSFQQSTRAVSSFSNQLRSVLGVLHGGPVKCEDSARIIPSWQDGCYSFLNLKKKFLIQWNLCTTTNLWTWKMWLLCWGLSDKDQW